MVAVAPVAVVVKINALLVESNTHVNAGEVNPARINVAALLKLVAEDRLIDEEVNNVPPTVRIKVPDKAFNCVSVILARDDELRKPEVAFSGYKAINKTPGELVAFV